MDGIRLSPERYEELLRAERELLDLLPEYDKLEDCGTDCGPLRAMNDEAIRRISKVKQHYAPRE